MKPDITSSHKLLDGQFLTITRNPRARRGEPIILSATLNKGRSWPMDALGVMLGEFQLHADQEGLSFDQTLVLHGDLKLKFAFAPGVPFVARPLVDDVKVPVDYQTEVIEAIRSRISPERLAEVYASLPVDAQRRVAAKCLVKPDAL